MPVSPVRGSISNAVDILLTIATVVVYTFLVFYVVDAVRLCKSFVQHLASGKSEWSINTVEKFTKIQQLGSSADNLRTVLKRDNYLRDYIDMRLIAERTEVIGGTIYYPFITLLLIIIARSSLLDNCFWNTALFVMFAASAAVIACSAYSLRSAAEHARELALRKLGSELLRAEAPQDDLAP